VERVPRGTYIPAAVAVKKNAGPFGPALQPMGKAAKGRFTPNRC